MSYQLRFSLHGFTCTDPAQSSFVFGVGNTTSSFNYPNSAYSQIPGFVKTVYSSGTVYNLTKAQLLSAGLVVCGETGTPIDVQGLSAGVVYNPFSNFVSFSFLQASAKSNPGVWAGGSSGYYNSKTGVITTQLISLEVMYTQDPFYWWVGFAVKAYNQQIETLLNKDIFINLTTSLGGNLTAVLFPGVGSTPLQYYSIGLTSAQNVFQLAFLDYYTMSQDSNLPGDLTPVTAINDLMTRAQQNSGVVQISTQTYSNSDSRISIEINFYAYYIQNSQPYPTQYSYGNADVPFVMNYWLGMNVYSINWQNRSNQDASFILEDISHAQSLQLVDQVSNPVGSLTYYLPLTYTDLQTFQFGLLAKNYSTSPSVDPDFPLMLDLTSWIAQVRADSSKYPEEARGLNVTLVGSNGVSFTITLVGQYTKKTQPTPLQPNLPIPTPPPVTNAYVWVGMKFNSYQWQSQKGQDFQVQLQSSQQSLKLCNKMTAPISKLVTYYLQNTFTSQQIGNESFSIDIQNFSTGNTDSTLPSSLNVTNVIKTLLTTAQANPNVQATNTVTLNSVSMIGFSATNSSFTVDVTVLLTSIAVPTPIQPALPSQPSYYYWLGLEYVSSDWSARDGNDFKIYLTSSQGQNISLVDQISQPLSKNQVYYSDKVLQSDTQLSSLKITNYSTGGSDSTLPQARDISFIIAQLYQNAVLDPLTIKYSQIIMTSLLNSQSTFVIDVAVQSSILNTPDPLQPPLPTPTPTPTPGSKKKERTNQYFIEYQVEQVVANKRNLANTGHDSGTISQRNENDGIEQQKKGDKDIEDMFGSDIDMSRLSSEEQFNKGEEKHNILVKYVRDILMEHGLNNYDAEQYLHEAIYKGYYKNDTDYLRSKQQHNWQNPESYAFAIDKILSLDEQRAPVHPFNKSLQRFSVNGFKQVAYDIKKMLQQNAYGRYTYPEKTGFFSFGTPDPVFVPHSNPTSHVVNYLGGFVGSRDQGQLPVIYPKLIKNATTDAATNATKNATKPVRNSGHKIYPEQFPKPTHKLKPSDFTKHPDQFRKSKQIHSIGNRLSLIQPKENKVQNEQLMLSSFPVLIQGLLQADNQEFQDGQQQNLLQKQLQNSIFMQEQRSNLKQFMHQIQQMSPKMQISRLIQYFNTEVPYFSENFLQKRLLPQSNKQIAINEERSYEDQEQEKQKMLDKSRKQLISDFKQGDSLMNDSGSSLENLNQSFYNYLAQNSQNNVILSILDGVLNNAQYLKKRERKSGFKQGYYPPGSFKQFEYDRVNRHYNKMALSDIEKSLNHQVERSSNVQKSGKIYPAKITSKKKIVIPQYIKELI